MTELLSAEYKIRINTLSLFSHPKTMVRFGSTCNLQGILTIIKVRSKDSMDWMTNCLPAAKKISTTRLTMQFMIGSIEANQNLRLLWRRLETSKHSLYRRLTKVKQSLLRMSRCNSLRHNLRLLWRSNRRLTKVRCHTLRLLLMSHRLFLKRTIIRSRRVSYQR